MLLDIETPIVIVGHRNAEDVAKCLHALARLRPDPSHGVFICENGGPASFEALTSALTGPDGPCAAPGAPPLATGSFRRMIALTFKDRPVSVRIAEAHENLGFAGGVNAWVRLLLEANSWKGVWILNPDTWPEPDALAALVRAAEREGKGLVGSRVMFPDRADIASSRGLKWRKLAATTRGVDIFKPVDPAPDPADVERRMDAPSGVSLYATRRCLDEVGLMDESYFLYFEDMEWGVRAKKICGIGYAHDSVVPHVGGSSTGAVRNRAQRSPLSVYLSYRNRLHFVKTHHARWYAWTVLATVLRASEYLVTGSPRNYRAALAGVLAALRQERGRPNFAPATSR